jgi:hypothetical protein
LQFNVQFLEILYRALTGEKDLSHLVASRECNVHEVDVNPFVDSAHLSSLGDGFTAAKANVRRWLEGDDDLLDTGEP